jgi:hypothetical protein
MAQKPWMPKMNSKKRVFVLISSAVLLVLLTGTISWALLSKASHTVDTHHSSATPSQAGGSGSQVTPNTPVSPLLFGTNLGLFNSDDQVLRSTTTRDLLRQIHTRIIRMPVRSGLSEATEIQAAQDIKNLGAIPLIVLHGADDPNSLTLDTRVVNDMNRIFGKGVVYYEFGNEEDWQGIDVASYTAAWNAIIPQLKRIALNGQFVGPVTYQYDRSYLTTFLQTAKPRPDEVSWHEYTCADSWLNDMCISHIDHWTNHINDARASMVAVIGSALPIMITEWNYAPDAVPNDGKNNDSSFMTTWTTKALQTLAANRIFASMQYSCTNTAISLIGNNETLTMQGQTFQNQYKQMIINGQQPAPAPTGVAGQPETGPTVGEGSTPNPNPTVLLNQHQSFSFEDGGTDGWSGHGNEVTSLQNSTAFALDGKHALQVTLTNIGQSDFPYVAVGSSNLVSSPHAGQTLIANVYVPTNTSHLRAQVFVMDSSYHWFSNAMATLTPGSWNRLTYLLPSTISSQVRLLGIQFNNGASSPMSSTISIDAVSWS